MSCRCPLRAASSCRGRGHLHANYSLHKGRSSTLRQGQRRLAVAALHSTSYYNSSIDPNKLKPNQEMQVISKGDVITLVPDRPLSAFRGVLRGMPTEGHREKKDRRL
jgi:hypothetical protein